MYASGVRCRVFERHFSQQVRAGYDAALRTGLVFGPPERDVFAYVVSEDGRLGSIDSFVSNGILHTWVPRPHESKNVVQLKSVWQRKKSMHIEQKIVFTVGLTFV